jgi:hypothetical protein
MFWTTVLLFALPGFSEAGHTVTNTDFPNSRAITEISFPGMVFTGNADTVSFTLPFSKAGNLMLVRGKADSMEGNFILDTGCPGLVLNLTYFRNYARTAEAQAENGGITGMSTPLEHTTIKSFSWGSMQQYNLQADLANLGTIENSKGVKILGLLGLQFFRNCEMIIDYEKSVIHFYMLGKKKIQGYQHPMLRDTAAYQVIPFEITENRIMVRTILQGKKLRLLIDCAAEVNILDSRLPDKIFDQVAITERVMLTGVCNRKVEALKGNLADFMIGNRTVQSMPVLITNLEKTCFAHGGCVDGVLGFDFLSLQKIGFNFVTRKMYIWK